MFVTRINNRLFLALIPLLLAAGTVSFVPTTSTTTRSFLTKKSFVLQDALREPTWDRDEVEAARQAFERLHLDDSTGTLKPGPLPMTSNVHRLRRMELQLLEALADSDQAIDPLVELWIRERQDAAEALHQMIFSRSRILDLDREEAILRQMIDDYGPDGWVEPHGRLAVLLFTRGEYMETIDLCDYVLYVKPWHFEVAQLLAITFLRVGDFENALQVTRHCVLPPLQHPKRRKRWIDKMTSLARNRLIDAEQISATATSDGLVVDECPFGQDCWQ